MIENLFAAFEHDFSRNIYGNVIRKQRMKIIFGGSILEDLYLEDLLHQSQDDERRAGTQQLTNSNRRVLVLVKKPVIAIRYQLPDGQQIRRMQMRFRHESHYDIIMAILKAAGLPIQERTEVQTLSQSSAKPSISSQELQQPSTSLELSSRPISYSRGGSQLQTNHSQSTNNHALEDGLISLVPHLQLDYTPLRRDPEAHDRFLAHNHTMASAVGQGPYEIHPEPTRHPQYFKSHLHTQLLSDSSYAIHEPSVLGPLTRMSTDTFSQVLPPKRDLPFAQPVAKRPRHEEDVAPLTEGLHKSDTVMAGGGSALKNPELGISNHVSLGLPSINIAASKHIALGNTDSGKVVVTKLVAKKASSTKNVTKNASSTKNVTKRSAPKKAVVKKATLKKAVQSKSGDKTAATTITEQTIPKGSLKASASDAPSGKTAHLIASARSSSLSSSLQPFRKTTVESPLISDLDKATSTLTELVADHEAISELRKSNNRPALSTRSGNEKTLARPEISQEWIDRVEQFIQQYQGGSTPPLTSASLVATPAPPSELEAYATLPKGVRRARLKQMMVDIIMDEDFVTLCEDVENVWQKIWF
ncbi:hypothetical protein MMC13_006484 [Lambiella insularis]|nr:hypothetical protein [Lambiella insularis]